MSHSDELRQQLLSILSEQPLLEECDDVEDSEKVYSEDDIILLKNRLGAFLQKYDFEKGQIVKWKEGLRNKKYPFENQPAIVVEILNPPLVNIEDLGTPYFREPMDVLLGFIDQDDDDFVVFHFDSRRFEPYETK